MKAIHNQKCIRHSYNVVVLYLKDTQKWKQFTTFYFKFINPESLCYISKILKNESNSQLPPYSMFGDICCVISQRYSKMKAIHNSIFVCLEVFFVVLYLKDTQKWKQFTTGNIIIGALGPLCYISKILKNESNSQHSIFSNRSEFSCVISQRYSKMKAIHNKPAILKAPFWVVLYLKDTQKWKQFTTTNCISPNFQLLCYISKILKNESNSQQNGKQLKDLICCVISQRYSKMKAIHNI